MVKIILTGKPITGKSTIIKKFLEIYDGKVNGVFVERMKDKDGFNHGFEAISVGNKRRVIAHRELIKSEIVVGNSHNVDIIAIEDFIVPEINTGITNNSLTIVDEIGRMQSLSEKFLLVINKLLESKADVLATIVYDPEPWSLDIKTNPNVFLVEVTHENRDLLPEVLNTMFAYTRNLDKLSKDQSAFVRDMTKKYISESMYIQLQKLYKNAVSYIADNKVTELNASKYEIAGNHDIHKLRVENNKYSCDCDLFNGKGKYKNMSGECSHIQAAKLYKLK